MHTPKITSHYKHHNYKHKSALNCKSECKSESKMIIINKGLLKQDFGRDGGNFKVQPIPQEWYSYEERIIIRING